MPSNQTVNDVEVPENKAVLRFSSNLLGIIQNSE